MIEHFRQVFNRIFNIFHNGRGGWIKVERNGGKWREDKGIMVRIGGYKNWCIGWVIESILRAVDKDKYKAGG